MRAARRPAAALALLGVAGAVAAAGAREEEEARLAARLNADFRAHPTAAGSPLGVLLHFGADTQLDIYCNTSCNGSVADAHDDRGPWNQHSDCRVSTSLFNQAYSIARGQNHCKAYSTGAIMAPDAFLPAATGWVYNTSVLSTALRCSYASDAGTRFRVNHGCGCNFDDQSLVKGHKYENACMNVDPWTGRKNTVDSKLVSTCRCSSPEEPPHADGEFKCFWTGPAFNGGHGKNQIRQMVQQRMNYPRNTQKCPSGHPAGVWDEVVLDASILQQQLVRDFPATIPAFFTSGAVTWEQACEWQRPILERYNLKACMPVLGFDGRRAWAPFSVLPRAAAAGAAAKPSAAASGSTQPTPAQLILP